MVLASDHSGTGSSFSPVSAFLLSNLQRVHVQTLIDTLVSRPVPPSKLWFVSDRRSCGGQTNSLAAGDGVDWMDPSYVKSYPSRKNSETAKAARGIVNRARSSAKQGPFSGFHVRGDVGVVLKSR